MTTVNKNCLNATKEAPFSSIASAAEKLRKFEFTYTTNGCDYHHEKDVEPNCCLSIVRRHGYMIAKWCSDGSRYQLQQGKHFPSGYIPGDKE
jgi:predicted DNA-binding transcriptional regulator YafY